MQSYGKELILDLHECEPSFFTRKRIKLFFQDLCISIDMTPADLHFWDYKGVPKKILKNIPDHLLGTSAIQFIETSNITIHTLDRLKSVYLNIFSCKDFDEKKVMDKCLEYFKGYVANAHIIMRY